MRQSIESGGFEWRQGKGLWRLYGAGVVVLLTVACQIVHSEELRVYPTKQNGSVSGAGVRGGAIKGAPSRAPGYLGILFQNLTDEQVTSMHVKVGNGVEVVMVDHDGPAGKAGLQPHDVIIRLNGQNVTNADCLRKMIHDDGVGAAVSLTVLRGGRQITVNTQLAYRGEVEKEAAARMVEADPPASGDAPVANEGGDGDPADPVAPDTASRSRKFFAQVLHTTPFTGLVLEAMEPQLAGFFGAPAGVGLLVETVAPNSPAATAGLRAGDVILKADSVEVKSNGVWVKELHETRGRGIALVVLRDRQEVRILLIPEVKKHSKVIWPIFATALPAVV
jgi:serine protease Do